MSTNIRLPQITGKNEREQLAQVRGYLYQLVGELNYALEQVQSSAPGGAANAQSTATTVTEDPQKSPKATFNSIKALIIKSADIVNSYYDEISKRLEGLYVAKSDFGEYKEATAAEIKANSTGVEQLYKNMQQIITDIDKVESTLINVTARIKTGLLDYDDTTGAPIYGLEVGQTTEIDGEEVFNKFARFTADRLSFYDSNDNEVAYISDRKLYISDVEVTGSFQISGFVDTVMGDKSVVTRWVGGGA